MEYPLLVMLLKDLVILPFQDIKLELKDEISKKIIKVSTKKYNDRVLIVSPEDLDNVAVDNLPHVGVVAYIKSKIDLSNGNLRLTLRGEKRVKALKYEFFSDEILSCQVTDIILPKLTSESEEVIKNKLKNTLTEYIDNTPSVSNSILKTINENNDLGFLTDVVTSFLPLNAKRKISYMQELNSEKRAVNLIKDIKLERKYLDLEEAIDSEVEEKLTKEQQEYYLKEKVKEIQFQLGLTSKNIEASKYEELLNNLNLDIKTKNKLISEIKRLANIPENSSEYSILDNYLNTVLNLPWNNLSKENLNVKGVINSLNKSHYGLNAVKEKIEDYINIKNLNNELASPVICLVGPPGIGKTTISESIAIALNREFYKISVGGLNDSTELVGSRRTYLGALPGKIISALKKCNTKNPVILIDEVDKMVKDYKGDPASTLLDILDSNQNKNFIDNYIEEPFDLSHVFFILTANNIEDIPYTLKDRLDIIELSSYGVYEKLDIAKKYILPRIYKEFKMTKKLIIKDDTLIYLIDNYTKEAGVRELTRVLRKLIIKMVSNKVHSYTINNEDIVKYLGKTKTINNLIEYTDSGIVNTLAYTNFGGEVTMIEVSLYSGPEEIITSGSLGDVLKESIKVAVSYIKEKGYVSNTLFYNHTIHVHMVDTGTKKEGPSSGMAITTALISKLLDKKIDNTLAFTGEITLKGNILKIGGLKEKLIAAYNRGIKKVYIPKDNMLMLEELPANIKENLEIKLVSNYDEVYHELFC